MKFLLCFLLALVLSACHFSVRSHHALDDYSPQEHSQKDAYVIPTMRDVS